MTAWLDYAVELGCNGLLLGPIFASQTHGCDTMDHSRIDRRLGDEDDFDALVTAAGQRGMRLVLDGDSITQYEGISGTRSPCCSVWAACRAFTTGTNRRSTV